MTTATSPRRGRPPKVRELEDGYAVNVRGTTYEFIERNGAIRPRNTRAGDPDDRAYAKSRVRQTVETA